MPVFLKVYLALVGAFPQKWPESGAISFSQTWPTWSSWASAVAAIRTHPTTTNPAVVSMILPPLAGCLLIPCPPMRATDLRPAAACQRSGTFVMPVSNWKRAKVRCGVKKLWTARLLESLAPPVRNFTRRRYVGVYTLPNRQISLFHAQSASEDTAK
jgi:hypothetical protein